MKALKLLSIALVVLGLSQSAQAQLKIVDTDTSKLYMTLATVGTAQSLEQKNVFNATTGAEMVSPSAGFQNAFGDFGFVGKFGKNQELELVFDMYLASRNHPSTTYGDEGYMILHGVPENLENLKFLAPVLSKVDIKAGQMLLGFGDAIYHRSNNAIVQKNPLVGNFVVDPNIVSIGVEVSNKAEGRLRWMAGVSNGTTTEDWNNNRGLAYHGKLAFYPVKSLRTSVSYITTNQSGNPAKSAGGSALQMFSGNRSGERYAGVLGGGQAPGGVFPQAGKKFSAAQFDVTYEKPAFPVKFYGNVGRTDEEDANGSLDGTPKEKWNYYAAQVVYNINENLYAAARYSGATTSMFNGAASDGKVGRVQVGGGFWLTRNVLMKVEYVQQKYDGFASGQVVNNGVAAWRNPEFKGLISEVSFSF